jgi:hypothetical protein
LNKTTGVGTITNPTLHDVTYSTCLYRINTSVYDQTLIGDSGPVTAKRQSTATIPFPDYGTNLLCGHVYNLQLDPIKGAGCPLDPNATLRGIFMNNFATPVCATNPVCAPKTRYTRHMERDRRYATVCMEGRLAKANRHHKYRR